MLGRPLGGAAIGLFGPVITVVADAVSCLVSAVGIRAIGGLELRPVRTDRRRRRAVDLLEGWRYSLAHPPLRLLFFNTILVNGLIMATSPLVNGLIMATSPLLAVLMLGRLGLTPWQYGLAFAAPCVGDLIGSRLARGLVRAVRAPQGHAHCRRAARVLVCGLAFIRPGAAGWSSS